MFLWNFNSKSSDYQVQTQCGYATSENRNSWYASRRSIITATLRDVGWCKGKKTHRPTGYYYFAKRRYYYEIKAKDGEYKTKRWTKRSRRYIWLEYRNSSKFNLWNWNWSDVPQINAVIISWMKNEFVIDLRVRSIERKKKRGRSSRNILVRSGEWVYFITSNHKLSTFIK